MAAINFVEAYDTFVKANQKTWSHDRSKSVGASEAFGCIRKTWFSKNGGVKNPDHKDSWGAMERGNLIENHFAEPAVRWFLETHFNEARLIWGGADQVTLVCADAPLTATPDGLIINADDDALEDYGIPSLGGTGCFNFEIKSVDPRVNLKEEKAIHRGQTIVQMGITRENYPEYQPNYAVIVYLDASFLDDIDVFVVPYDQKTFDAAKNRARRVYKDPLPQMFPEGKVDGNCEYCPFTQECSRALGKATPTDGLANEQNTSSALMQEFEVLVRAERAASAAKKSLEADHKEASEKLKAWLSDVGVKRAEVPGVAKVSISWIKGRKTYDIEAMRVAGLDVESFTKEGEGHSRLSISEKGPQTADET